MKKMKRILSLLVAMVLVAAIFAGCSSSSTQTSDENLLSCTITIDATTASEAGYEGAGDGVMLAETTVNFSEGETAYDVLSDVAQQNDFPVVKADASGFVYITGINSLSEGDIGSYSGWMYSVNGEYVQVSCSEYEVQEGDALVFIYTCDGGTDIGAW
ncbi:MAG: DUF4430 domain-containing protein [Eubacteriales bacterium]